MSTPSAAERPSRRRRLAAFAIVVFWLGMTAWLIHRQLGPRQLPAAASPEEADTWLGVFLGDQQVGRLHLLQAPQERQGLPGHGTTLNADLALQLFGKPTDLHLAGDIWRATAGDVAELAFTVRSGEHLARIDGRLAEGRLRGAVVSAGESFPLDLPVAEELLVSGGFGSAVRLPPLAVGEEYQVDSFDPVTLAAGRSRLRCIRQETITVAGADWPARVVEIDSGGLRSTAWIAADGEVLRAETPLGLTLEKIPPPAPDAQAVAAQVPSEEGSGEGPGKLLELTAIRPSGSSPFRGAQRLHLHLQLPASAPAPPSDAHQRAEGDGIYLLEPPQLDEAGRPRVAGEVLADPDPYLRADPFVQSDHPRIRAQAEAIVAGAADPWTRARRLNDWLYQNIDKRAVLGLPSALEVLETRAGDCNEHAVLYTALARAAGVPARIAIGVVWSDEASGFYYHAWPEVYLPAEAGAAGGGWVPLDPTLGQTVADATHLKLLTGGIESWTRLLPYLGQLGIEVLAVE